MMKSIWCIKFLRTCTDFQDLIKIYKVLKPRNMHSSGNLLMLCWNTVFSIMKITPTLPDHIFSKNCTFLPTHQSCSQNFWKEILHAFFFLTLYFVLLILITDEGKTLVSNNFYNYKIPCFKSCVLLIYVIWSDKWLILYCLQC